MSARDLAPVTTTDSSAPRAALDPPDLTPATAAPGPALEVLDLAAVLGGHVVLDGVSATAPTAAVTAVVGPNGSGKSTLLRTVVGALPPGRGAVRLAGEDLLAMGRRRRARELALVEQDSAADVSLDVLDVVLLGRTPHSSRWGGDSDADVALASDALARVGAADLAHRDVATLSGGERQRVHLARALAQQPGLLLLDEPTNHLDVAAQLAVLGLARSLAATGMTVLTALHDLDHALRFCDQVVVLQEGRVVAAGPPGAVLTAELVSAVYGVRARRATVDGRDLLLLDPA
ncbi:ABC transporter ATP-binding protein [Georgenia muralis]|uniref:Iron complex transport system ATP-binding protein n=1 Tax=Georgenia muralis TaxID=154117 RepID=A0A3N4ZQH6_9MICO|nr:ABC transporter ATP-binding protein [Georgenia muralis]RPF27802.1 iron complex transport system ATP-binding protein [Georgenia muralis]